MRAAYCIIVWLLVSMALITTTLCITHDAALVSLPNTAVTLAAMSTFAATSNTGLKMTIAITNLYEAQLSLLWLGYRLPTPIG
jgi:hypothetical protein